MLAGISSGRNGLNHHTLNIMSGDPLETANINEPVPFSVSGVSPIGDQSPNVLSQVQ